VAIWNGSGWRQPAPLATVAGTSVQSLGVFGGALYAGGNITDYNNLYYIVKLNTGAPTITGNPVNDTTCRGGPASFTVTATGSGTLAYHWRHNTTPIATEVNPSAATATLTIPFTASTDRGTYDCVVSNTCAGVTSSAAFLTVNSADFNNDGDIGTDADIGTFFACLAGNCCPACGTSDFNADGDVGTDADIEAFFRVLAGGSC
jgi:hypothetical protein